MKRTIAIALWLCACSEEAQETEWSLRFQDSAAVDRASLIEALVFDGGCDGELVYRAEVPRMGPGAMPPRLGPGLYGFAGVARDLECRTIARGCVEAQLPLRGGARLSVLLADVDEPAACAIDRCADGRCEGTVIDSGPFEAYDGGVVIDRYYVSTSPNTWSGAETECSLRGGHLATIDDAVEESLVLDRTGGDPHWIGLSDREDEGMFLWSDGSDATYRRWADGAPRSSPMWRDCVAMSDETAWDDRRCTDMLPFVCELP